METKAETCRKIEEIVPWLKNTDGENLLFQIGRVEKLLKDLVEIAINESEVEKGIE